MSDQIRGSFAQETIFATEYAGCLAGFGAVSLSALPELSQSLQPGDADPICFAGGRPSRPADLQCPGAVGADSG